MARVRGMIIRDSNYEVTTKKPLDARSLVKTYEDLTNNENWIAQDTGKSICYNGMLVAVANTSDMSRNGLYFLFDPECTTSLKSPDVTVETNWIKVGETSDISEFAERVATIESELAFTRDRLDELSAIQKDVVGLQTSIMNKTEVVVETSTDLPLIGDENLVYIIEDVSKRYLWTNVEAHYYEYVPEYQEIQIIHGGSSAVVE